MPFPFYPIGALVAGAVLLGALTVFVAALMAMDRAVSRASGAAGSVVSGLVSGVRGWSAGQTPDVDRPSASSATPDDGSIEAAPPIAVDRVRSRRR